MKKNPAAEWFDQNVGLDGERLNLNDLWRAMDEERSGRFTSVEIRDDDSQTGMLHLSIAHGDVFIETAIDRENEKGLPPTYLRFRSHYGGGKSLRVRMALIILAAAIAADNADKA